MRKLRLHGISKHYGRTRAVSDFSLDVEEGELLAILGPSGCGKSTLLSCIAGIEKPDAGRIILSGRTLYSSKEGIDIPPEERGNGFVFQNYALWPHMSVYRNLAYPLRMRKISKDRIDERVNRMLSRIRLEGKAGKHPWQLSGGEQQRVALGRALIMDPELLLLDEPLSNLDAGLRENMQAEIRSLRRELNLTVIHVTHDQSEAMAMADRIVVMNEGSPVQAGTPEEIYTQPGNSFVAGFVGMNNLLTGRLSGEGNDLWFENGSSIRFPLRSTEYSNGREVMAVIRPEDIRLLPAGEEDNPTGTGVISDVVYRGAHIQYTVAAPGTTLRVQSHPDERFVTGDRVAFSFSHYRIIPLPGSGEMLKD